MHENLLLQGMRSSQNTVSSSIRSSFLKFTNFELYFSWASTVFTNFWTLHMLSRLQCLLIISNSTEAYLYQLLFHQSDFLINITKTFPKSNYVSKLIHWYNLYVLFASSSASTLFISLFLNSLMMPSAVQYIFLKHNRPNSNTL